MKDGEVYLNDTVKVIITDIVASNGVIHIIDSVLLPPAEAMAAEEMMAPEPVHIRVAHFSLDTPAVDVFVNGDAAIQNLEFPTVTDWIELPAGRIVWRLLRRVPVSKRQRLDPQNLSCLPGHTSRWRRSDRLRLER